MIVDANINEYAEKIKILHIHVTVGQPRAYAVRQG